MSDAGQAEIEDLDPSLMGGIEPDVAGLDVAVDQAAFVGGGQPLGDLPADPQHLGDARLAALLQPLVQRHALEELHRQEGDAVVLIDLEDGDDVVVVDGGHGLGLAQEALAGAGVGGQAGQHRLEGDEAFQLEVFGLVDDAHAAAAQFLEDAIAAQPADLVGLLRRRQRQAAFLRRLKRRRRRARRRRCSRRSAVSCPARTGAMSCKRSRSFSSSSLRGAGVADARPCCKAEISGSSAGSACTARRQLSQWSTCSSRARTLPRRSGRAGTAGGPERRGTMSPGPWETPETDGAFAVLKKSMRLPDETCHEKKRRPLEDPQAGQFLAQPAQHAAGGQVDRVDAHAQLGGDLRGGPADGGVFPAGLPGRGLELGLHQFQGADGEMPLKLLFRQGGDFVGAASFGNGRRPCGGRAATDLAPLVHQDGAQPVAKALVPVVGELRQLADEQGEDFLNEVGGVRLLQADAPRPVEEQRRIEIDEAPPRLAGRRADAAVPADSAASCAWQGRSDAQDHRPHRPGDGII